MKFKIDENLPIELVNILQKAGYDAVSVLEESLRGCSDDMIVSVCNGSSALPNRYSIGKCVSYLYFNLNFVATMFFTVRS